MHEALFEPIDLGAIHAKNRIVMAPLTRGRSTQPGSVPNAMMLEYYRQRPTFRAVNGAQPPEAVARELDQLIDDAQRSAGAPAG